MKITIFDRIPRETLESKVGNLEVVSIEDGPQAVFLRSTDLKPIFKRMGGLGRYIFAICRAGSGVDNVPIDWCNQNGIVVLNAPGANALAVRDSVVEAMIRYSRKTVAARKKVEEYLRDVLRTGKNNPEETARALDGFRGGFVGKELKGKSILVIGLGYVGKIVAKTCLFFEMTVYGYDPYVLSENTPGVIRINSFDQIPPCDFVTLHPSLTEETGGMIKDSFFEKIQKPFVLLNFARGEIIDEIAIRSAIEGGKVKFYISDFGNLYLYSLFPDQTEFTPHIGGSTLEAQKRALEMVSDQFVNFWRSGSVLNSPNLPAFDVKPKKSANLRLLISNKSVPGVINGFTDVLRDRNYNITGFHYNEDPSGEWAYNVVDINNASTDVEKAVEEIRRVPHVTKVRAIIL